MNEGRTQGPRGRHTIFPTPQAQGRLLALLAGFHGDFTSKNVGFKWISGGIHQQTDINMWGFGNCFKGLNGFHQQK
jgi:hypothetical protein